SSFNRGQFNPAENSQGEFHTYTIDWTKDRLLWAVDDIEVRTLDADKAEENQYPQSPMQVKFGSWAGGDPSNPEGTIGWAGGRTNYENGPYTMVVKSIHVADYSTGKEYVYTDNSGSWESIEAVDGEVNGNEGNIDGITITGSAAPPTSTKGPIIPPGGIGRGEENEVMTQTGWPFDPDATPDGWDEDAPDGWIITEEGKLIPMAGGTGALRPSVAVMGSLLLGVVAFFGHVA
ncbi:family 16 glycosylhydrolase, partial [Candidatus Bathyarchaeota archaeon]|nr:family 16 glycosylhydrolase [Candidatus Bathyarchaeota archaeon]